MDRLLKKIISTIVLVCFLFNAAISDYAFALGTAPGSTQPGVVHDMYAGGQKKFAAKIGPGKIEWDKYVTGPRKFTGRTPTLPAGLRFVNPGPDRLPPGLEKSSFFQNLDKMRDPASGKVSIVKALEYYLAEEAKIPASKLKIQDGTFDIKEADGELGIARIEDIEDHGNYRKLVIHKDFIKRWNHILENDIWFEYTFPDGQKRMISVAWALFFRVAKHEMTDLAKKGLLPKGNISHITAYPGLEDIFVSESELAANLIQGRFNLINDAIWMWFLGSYCYNNNTRYDNDTLSARLNWFFDGEEARKLKLNLEFPNLLEDGAKRQDAIDMALLINREFFGEKKSEPALESPAEEKDAKKENLRKLADFFARYFIAQGIDLSRKYSFTDQSSPDAILNEMSHVVQEAMEKGIVYIIMNKGSIPTAVYEIENVSKEQNQRFQPVRTRIAFPPTYLTCNIKGFMIRILGEVSKDPNSHLYAKIKELSKTSSIFAGVRPRSVVVADQDLRRLVEDTLFSGIGQSNSFYLKSAQFMDLVKERMSEIRFEEEYETRKKTIKKVYPATGAGAEIPKQKTPQDSLKTVTLKNGATEAEPLVRVTMLSLQTLMQTNPIAFYELVMKARDPNHEFFDKTEDDLKALSLVQSSGRLHELIRNIVLSASEGEGLDMKLVSPIKPAAQKTNTQPRNVDGKFKRKRDKSPADQLVLIAEWLEPDGIITAPDLAEKYINSWNPQQQRYDRISENKKSVTRIAERGLYESNNSLLNVGLVKELKRGERGIRRFKLTAPRKKAIPTIERALEIAAQDPRAHLPAHVFLVEKLLSVAGEKAAPSIAKALEISIQNKSQAIAQFLLKKFVSVAGRKDIPTIIKMHEFAAGHMEWILTQILSDKLEELARGMVDELLKTFALQGLLDAFDGAERLDWMTRPTTPGCDVNIGLTVVNMFESLGGHPDSTYRRLRPLIREELKHRLYRLYADPARAAQAPAAKPSRTHRPDGKSRRKSGKSPEDLLVLLTAFPQEGGIITAPYAVKLYAAHWEKFRFDPPSENDLRTKERDLYEADDSLLAQKLVTELPERGEDGERRFIIFVHPITTVERLTGDLIGVSRGTSAEGCGRLVDKIIALAGKEVIPSLTEGLKAACFAKNYDAAFLLADKIIELTGKKAIPSLLEGLKAAYSAGGHRAITYFLARKIIRLAGKEDMPYLLEGLKATCSAKDRNIAKLFADKIIALAGKEDLPFLTEGLKAACSVTNENHDIVRFLVDNIIILAGTNAAPFLMEGLKAAWSAKDCYASELLVGRIIELADGKDMPLLLEGLKAAYSAEDRDAAVLFAYGILDQRLLAETRAAPQAPAPAAGETPDGRGLTFAIDSRNGGLVNITNPEIHDLLDKEIEKYFPGNDKEADVTNSEFGEKRVRCINYAENKEAERRLEFTYLDDLQNVFRDLVQGTTNCISKNPDFSHLPSIKVLKTEGEPILTLEDGIKIWGHASDRGICIADSGDAGKNSLAILYELLRFMAIDYGVIRMWWETIYDKSTKDPGEAALRDALLHTLSTLIKYQSHRYSVEIRWHLFQRPGDLLSNLGEHIKRTIGKRGFGLALEPTESKPTPASAAPATGAEIRENRPEKTGGIEPEGSAAWMNDVNTTPEAIAAHIARTGCWWELVYSVADALEANPGKLKMVCNLLAKEIDIDRVRYHMAVRDDIRRIRKSDPEILSKIEALLAVANFPEKFANCGHMGSVEMVVEGQERNIDIVTRRNANHPRRPLLLAELAAATEQAIERIAESCVMIVLADAKALRGDFDLDGYSAAHAAMSKERRLDWPTADPAVTRIVFQRILEKGYIAETEASAPGHAIYRVTMKGRKTFVPHNLRRLIEDGRRDMYWAVSMARGDGPMYKRWINRLNNQVPGLAALFDDIEELRALLAEFVQWYESDVEPSFKLGMPSGQIRSYVEAFKSVIVKKLSERLSALEALAAPAPAAGETPDGRGLTFAKNPKSGRPVNITDPKIHDLLDKEIEKYFPDNDKEAAITNSEFGSMRVRSINSDEITECSPFLISSHMDDLWKVFHDLIGGAANAIDTNPALSHPPSIKVLKTEGKPILTLEDGTEIWGHASDRGICIADTGDSYKNSLIILYELLRFMAIDYGVIRIIFDESSKDPDEAALHHALIDTLPTLIKYQSHRYSIKIGQHRYLRPSDLLTNLGEHIKRTTDKRGFGLALEPTEPKPAPASGETPKDQIKIDDNAIPSLEEALSNRNQSARDGAWEALEKLNALTPVLKAKKLIADMNYTDKYDISERAIQGLGQLGAVTDEVIPTLRWVLEESNWVEKLRISAMKALSTIAIADKKTVQSLIPVFIGYLTHDSFDRRRIAFDTLNTIAPNDENVIKMFIEIAQNGNENEGIRMPAIAALGEHKPMTDQTAQALEKALESKGGEARKAARDILTRHGRLSNAAKARSYITELDYTRPRFPSYTNAINELVSIGPDAIPSLEEALSSRNQSARDGAWEALEKLNALTPQRKAKKLIADMSHTDKYDISDRAIQGLGQLGAVTDEVVPTLLWVLEKSNWKDGLRANAAKALSTIAPNDENVITVFIEVAQKDNEYEGIRVTAIAALGEHKPMTDQTAQALENALESKGGEARKAARDILARHGRLSNAAKARSYIAGLYYTYNTGSPSYTNAINELVNIGPDAIPSLEEVLGNEQYSVRDGAWEALEKLNALTPQRKAKKFIADIGNSRDYDTLDRAIQGLGQLGAVTDKVVPTLLWALGRGDFGDSLHANAAKALSTIAPNDENKRMAASQASAMPAAPARGASASDGRGLTFAKNPKSGELVHITDPGIHDLLDKEIEKYFPGNDKEAAITNSEFGSMRVRRINRDEITKCSPFLISSHMDDLAKVFYDLFVTVTANAIDTNPALSHRPSIKVLKTEGKPILTLKDGIEIWGHASDRGICIADTGDSYKNSLVILYELLRFMAIDYEVIKGWWDNISKGRTDEFPSIQVKIGYLSKRYAVNQRVRPGDLLSNLGEHKKRINEGERGIALALEPTEPKPAPISGKMPEQLVRQQDANRQYLIGIIATRLEKIPEKDRGELLSAIKRRINRYVERVVYCIKMGLQPISRRDLNQIRIEGEIDFRSGPEIPDSLDHDLCFEAIRIVISASQNPDISGEINRPLPIAMPSGDLRSRGRGEGNIQLSSESMSYLKRQIYALAYGNENTAFVESALAQTPAQTPAEDLSKRTKPEATAPDMREVISVYAARLGLGRGPGSITEPTVEEIASFYPVYGELNAQRAQLCFSQHAYNSLTASVKEDIKALNKRIRERTGRKDDAISIAPVDSSNLRNMLGRKGDGVRRIFVNDAYSAAWFRGLLESKDPADMDLLKGNRIFSTELFRGGDDIENSVIQMWLTKVSILSCLLNDSNMPTVGSALKAELEGRLEGNINEFIGELAKEEDSQVSREAVARRVSYFLGKIVRLSAFTGEQLRILKAFAIAA